MGQLQRLAREIGADERTLRRAVAGGVVRSRRPTPRRLDLSAEESAYLRSHWELLGAARAVLRTEPNVRFAALYGSTARGDDDEGSDIDLVVELGKRDRRGMLRLRRKLEVVLGRPVRLAHFAEVKRAPLMLADVLRDGRPLVDRAGRWSQLRQARKRIMAAARRAERELLAGERDAVAYFAREASA